MDRIGTAIIGCGKVGEIHARAYAELKQSKFIGAYDTSQIRVAAFAHRFGIKPYTDLHELLANSDVHMVSICTPHPTHPDIAVTCAQAGKHILVEKPFAVDLAGCDRMITAARTAGVNIAVVSQRRYYEPVQRVKQAIEKGKIGKPILASLEVMGWRDEAYYKLDQWRGKWDSEGGGVLVNQTSHHLDLFQWLMGPIDELFGYWANLNHPFIEVEDNAIAVIRFKNGALATLLVSNSQKPGFYAKIHVHGDNGASVGVQTDSGSPFIAGITKEIEPPFNDMWTVPGEADLLGTWQEEDRKYFKKIDIATYFHQIQIEEFIQATIGGRKPAISFDEARKHVELFVAIYRSQRDSKPVRFPLNGYLGSEDFDGRLKNI